MGSHLALLASQKYLSLANTASIPELSLGGAEQSNYLKQLMHPGDRVEYGELPIQFLVDEDMLNYTLIHNWMTGLGFPRVYGSVYREWVTNGKMDRRDSGLQYSDATLKILNSNYNTTAQIKFWDLYPTSLSTLEFTATDTDVNYSYG